MWQSWVNGLIGLWLLLSSFIGMSTSAMAWNVGIFGAVVAILAFWAASAKK